MNDDVTLEAMANQIERQSAALAQFERELTALGDVELDVPTAFLDELESLAAPRGAIGWVNINGVRA